VDEDVFGWCDADVVVFSERIVSDGGVERSDGLGVLGAVLDVPGIGCDDQVAWFEDVGLCGLGENEIGRHPWFVRPDCDDGCVFGNDVVCVHCGIPSMHWLLWLG